MSSACLSGAFRPSVARAPQVVREREILRVAASFEGCDGILEAENARKEVLTWIEGRAEEALPPEAWSCDGFDHRAGGRDCSAVRIAETTSDVWAIRANEPDGDVPQRTWTTEVVIGVTTKRKPLIGLRLIVSSPEEHLPIEPATPSVLRQIQNKYDLYIENERLSTEPRTVESYEDVERLIGSLLDPKRRIPIVVLSVPPGAFDSYTPLLDPGPLALALLGLARVIVLPARFTWPLTERLGKRLSVFGGAARIYLPGFTEDADPYNHDLVLATRLSTRIQTRQASDHLRREVSKDSLSRLKLDRDVLAYSTVRARSHELENKRFEKEDSTIGDKLRAALGEIDMLKENLKKIQTERDDYFDKWVTEEEKRKSAQSNLDSAQGRIDQLTEQLSAQGRGPDSDIRFPRSWTEFSDWCDEHLSGRVQLSPRSVREVKDPQYKDIGVAARCLLWLANDYRKARMSGGDGDLRRQIFDGVKNDRCGADSFEFSWRGRRVRVAWHIKNGGTTRDPGRCLRVYYFWDDASQQVVIASMPAHIRTGAT